MPPRVEGQLSEALISSLEEGVVGADRTGSIRIFNAAAGSVFSLNSREVIGKNAWEVLPKCEFTRAFISQIKDNNPEPVKRLMLFPDHRMFAVKIQAVRSDRGRNLGAYAVMRDMSGVQKIERGFDEIFNSLTREISGPLTTIKGFVETLLEGAYLNNQVTHRFLQIINGEANNLVRLVMSLDSVIHLDKEAVPVKERFRLEELLSSCISMFEPVAAGKGIVIERDFSADLPWISGDEKLLRKVFMNLIDNAVRYVSVKGKGRVTVSLKIKERIFEVSIRDNGVGIAENDLPHIFERFYRGHMPEAEQLGGSGLGLSVAESIVTAHGGSITAANAEGGGAVFTVKLPVR